jgi:hypothetical protein
VMFKLTLLSIVIALAAVVALGQAPTLQIVEPDGPNLPADIYYGNVKIKPLRLRPGTNQVITIDDADFFVNEHYVDFLNRFPDQAGFNYWIAQITACGADATCIRNKRIDVSNAFFYEQEYHQTGGYAFRLYRIAFGNNQPSPNPEPDPQYAAEAKKIPLYSAFKTDRQAVVAGNDLPGQQLALANSFVVRAPFMAKYPAGLATADQFVDAVLATVQGDLQVDLSSQRQALINLYNGPNGGRGAVMYRLADENVTNPIDNHTLIDAEYNRAFVYAEYSGYLRRDSDMKGFLFWVNEVNKKPVRDTGVQHAMVCSFITSQEYQLRFGSTATHTNAECPQ